MSVDEFFSELEQEANVLDEEQRNIILNEWHQKWTEAQNNNVSEDAFLASIPTAHEIITHHSSSNQSSTIVEFNPQLQISDHNLDHHNKNERPTEEDNVSLKEKHKRTKKQKVLWALTFPFWFLLLVVIFGFALTITISYIGIFVASLAVAIYGLFVVVGSVFHIMNNVFGGLLQLGIGIFGSTLIFWIIIATNQVIKGSWKLLRRTIRWIGGR